MTNTTMSRIGWTMSGLMIAFLLMDATMKLLALPIVLETSAPLGFVGAEMARALGAVLLVATLLYALPPTAVLGAILVTGYLGGAIATHVRVGSPLFSPHPVRRVPGRHTLGRPLLPRRTPASADPATPLVDP